MIINWHFESSVLKRRPSSPFDWIGLLLLEAMEASEFVVLTLASI